MELNINIKTSEITDIEAIKAVKTNKENEQAFAFNFDTVTALIRTFAPALISYLMRNKAAANVVAHIIHTADGGNNPLHDNQENEPQPEPRTDTDPEHAS